MTDLVKVAIEDYLPLPFGPEQYPPEFSDRCGAIKLRESDDIVEIGVADGAEAEVLETLRNFHRGKRVDFRSLDRTELAGYLGKTAAALQDGGSQHAESRERSRIFLDQLASDAPVVNLVNSLLIDGIRASASDIHIEAAREVARVRYRIDGVLRTAATMDPSKLPAVASRIKIMANLNIMERRQPQDGRISVHIGDESVDLRVSIVPVAGGESLVLRLFNRSGKPRLLDSLGFSADDVLRIRGFLKIPHGLILVTGPTGSGKTTTLNAMLRELVSDERKIIAIEDPVEYLIDGVNQIQTNESIGLTFETILRRVLRQDPNVIMVGEIRDQATAELAVRASLTGHLVLTTLHTNTSAAAVTRLRNMGLEPYLIGSVLRGVIAQRLVRTICPNCSRERPALDAEKELFKKNGFDVKRLSEGVGCEACGKTGYQGRTLVAESFSMGGELEELISRGCSTAELSDRLTATGMRGLAKDGLAKAMIGATTLSELEREVSV